VRCCLGGTAYHCNMLGDIGPNRTAILCTMHSPAVAARPSLTIDMNYRPVLLSRTLWQ
jgi:hypothetical protein